MTIQKIFFFFADNIQRMIHRRKPPQAQLQHCKLISHRGEYDNKTIFENTIPAFEKVLQAGVWGVELDIRWTKDLEPVVFHDVDLKRLFNSPIKVSEINFADLRKHFPQIPSLEEVVSRFGKKLHLMIEFKKEPYPNSKLQEQRLQELLNYLSPIKDFHIISIHPEIFRHFKFLPSKALAPISIISYRKKSQIALENHYAGVLGHYQFLSHRRIKQHLAAGEKLGVGFVDSKNSLYREVNRGVEWLFSNKASKLQCFLNQK